MKVLLATWSWRPVGGDWTYVENVKKLYESKGYEVIPFSTRHENNAETEYDEYFSKGYDYKDLNKNRSIKSGFKALKNSVVSFEALRNIEQLLQEHEIAFAHLHTIHHWVTPAIIWKLKKYNVPVMWTLHEYKLLCPEGTFVSNGKICEKCYDKKFYNCATNKCKKNSFLASSLASIDSYFYHATGIYNKVNLYLCPSKFLLKKFEQFGFPSDKLVLSNYCYDISFLDKFLNERRITATNKNGKYIFYVGRLEKLKGVLTLIKAVEGTDILLKIAGTGPAKEEMDKYVKDKGLTNVHFLGYLQKKEVYEFTLHSFFVVCPSEWYENYPFSVIESLLLSKAVIGSKIGGIPELVIDGRTGLLFEPGNYNDLKEKLLKLWNDSLLNDRLGKEARRHAEERVSFQNHWKILNKAIATLPGRTIHQQESNNCRS